MHTIAQITSTVTFLFQIMPTWKTNACYLTFLLKYMPTVARLTLANNRCMHLLPKISKVGQNIAIRLLVVCPDHIS